MTASDPPGMPSMPQRAPRPSPNGLPVPGRQLRVRLEPQVCAATTAALRGVRGELASLAAWLRS